MEGEDNGRIRELAYFLFWKKKKSHGKVQERMIWTCKLGEICDTLLSRSRAPPYKGSAHSSPTMKRQPWRIHALFDHLAGDWRVSSSCNLHGAPRMPLMPTTGVQTPAGNTWNIPRCGGMNRTRQIRRSSFVWQYVMTRGERKRRRMRRILFAHVMNCGRGQCKK